MSVRPCERPKQKQVLLRVKSDDLAQCWLGQGRRRQDLRSILERGFVKRKGVKNAILIHTMDKLNISLLPLVSFQLLHPATSELFLPLPNRLLVQLFRMIASFPSTSRPGPSTFSFTLDRGASTSCTCQLHGSRSSLTASPSRPP